MNRQRYDKERQERERNVAREREKYEERSYRQEEKVANKILPIVYVECLKFLYCVPLISLAKYLSV